ncbi:MAG: hypothetical protein ACO1NX_03715 [Chitinophagaceae bacterium]
MVRFVLPVLFFTFISTDAYCQSGITEAYLQSFKKKMFDKIVIGNKSEGTAYFFPKGTGNVFSIIDRKKYGATPLADSSTNIAYFFRNDTLIKASFSRYYRGAGNKPFSEVTIHLYFKEGQIVEKKGNQQIWVPDTNFSIREAMNFLANSKALIINK